MGGSGRQDRRDAGHGRLHQRKRVGVLSGAAGPDVFFILVAVLGGAAVGSFLNVVIYRLPRASAEGTSVPRALMGPRSACPACERTIPAFENVPLLSYAVLGGRCRGCGARISLRYPLIEGLSALAAGGLAWCYGLAPEALAGFVFVALGLVIAAIDAEHMMVPDVLSLPLLALGLIVNGAGLFVPFPEAAIGAVAGFASLWLVWWAARALTGRDALGYGDFKLFAAIGAWLGWGMLPLVLFLGSLLGCAVGLTLRALGRLGAGVPIPFAPFLVAGGIAALFWGRPLALLIWPASPF